MSYPGRHNIYEATIRRMVKAALEEQELRFRQEHAQDTEAELTALLRAWVLSHGYTPWPGELPGGCYLAERFGSWERLVTLAGLTMPTHPNCPQSFARISEETERQKGLYRRKKTEKKQLARKRLADQADKRRRHGSG